MVRDTLRRRSQGDWVPLIKSQLMRCTGTRTSRVTARSFRAPPAHSPMARSGPCRRSSRCPSIGLPYQEGSPTLAGGSTGQAGTSQPPRAPRAWPWRRLPSSGPSPRSTASPVAASSSARRKSEAWNGQSSSPPRQRRPTRATTMRCATSGNAPRRQRSSSGGPTRTTGTSPPGSMPCLRRSSSSTRCR